MTFDNSFLYSAFCFIERYVAYGLSICWKIIQIDVKRMEDVKIYWQP